MEGYMKFYAINYTIDIGESYIGIAAVSAATPSKAIEILTQDGAFNGYRNKLKITSIEEIPSSMVNSLDLENYVRNNAVEVLRLNDIIVAKGDKGDNGINGESVYDMFVSEGLFTGTREEFIQAYKNALDEAINAGKFAKTNGDYARKEGLEAHKATEVIKKLNTTIGIQEDERVANEINRVTNEENRVAGFNTNIELSNKAIQDITNSIADADVAINNANTAAQLANTAADTINNKLGKANGIATLDNNAKVPVEQLPLVNQSSNGVMSKEDKTKLDAIKDSVVQSIANGQYTADKINLVYRTIDLATSLIIGSNIVIGAATQDQAGVMSADSFKKLTKLEEIKNANASNNFIEDVDIQTKYPNSIELGLHTINPNTQAKEIIPLEIPSASLVSAGLMSADDKKFVNQAVIGTPLNLFDLSKAKKGVYQYFENGKYGIAGGNDYYTTTDFIKIDKDGLYINLDAPQSEIIMYVIYDDNLQPIGHSKEHFIPYQEGAKYVRFTLDTSLLSGVMVNIGNKGLPYVPYNPIDGWLKDKQYLTSDSVIDKDHTNFIKEGANLFNKDEITHNAYVIAWNGELKEDSEGWDASDFIPVEPLTKYSSNIWMRDYAFYDADKKHISGKSEVVRFIITPEKARFIRFSIRYVDDNVTKVMFNKGNELPFEPYYWDFIYPRPNDKASNKIEISLPDKIDAVVGDELQLFYRGMIKAVNPYIYDIVPDCPVGAALPRYFKFRITAPFTHKFVLKVKDSNGNLLGQKSCNIVAKKAVKQPSTKLNVLFIGDSLTNHRIYPKEAFRRLTKKGGNPVGNGFGNIDFVGRKKMDCEGTSIGCEGNSGWSWSDYLTSGRKAYTFNITAPSVMPSAEAIYKDADGNKYEMFWDYSNTKVKMLCTDNGQPSPKANGILTKTSGEGDGTLTYSSVVESSGNPFWNDDTNSLDIKGYVDKWCGGQLDVVYTLLSWNGQTANRTNFTSFTNYAKELYSAIHQAYPSAKIKMMGVQLPDLRYGNKILGAPHEDTYTDCYGLSVTALNMNKAYQDFANSADFKDYVEFVNVSSQFDSEYNMPFHETPVNSRNNSVTEKVGNNDVHPSENGYLQIADVVYRNFIANFCQ